MDNHLQQVHAIGTYKIKDFKNTFIMKKIIIIIISILVVLLAALGIYLIVFSPKPTTPSYEQIKPLPSPEKPQGDQFSITTGQGNVMVNNFFNSAEKIIETSVYLKDSQNYVIIYNSGTKQFLIVLYGMTVDENYNFRQTAEADFVKILGINQSDACKLPVDLEVSKSHDSNLSGTNYNLSFCPNGIPFPGQSINNSQETGIQAR